MKAGDGYLVERIVTLANALHIRPADLGESVARVMPIALEKAAGFSHVAIVAIPRKSDNSVDVGMVLPDSEGVLCIPRGAEMIVAFQRAGAQKVGDVMDYAILHDDGCPSLKTSLMMDCRCNPEAGPVTVIGSVLEPN